MHFLSSDIVSVREAIPIAIAIFFTIIYLIFSGGWILTESNRFTAFIQGGLLLVLFLVSMFILNKLSSRFLSSKSRDKLKRTTRSLDSIVIIYILLASLSKFFPILDWMGLSNTYINTDEALLPIIVGMSVSSFIYVVWYAVRKQFTR